MPAKAAPSQMTRAEVIGYLGKSKRTIAQYMADGKLPASYVSGPNGRETRFQVADVERLRTEIDTPVFRAAPVKPAMKHTAQTNSTALAPVEAVQTIAPFAEAFAASLRTALHRDSLKPWLTLDEAAAYSGLPKSFLLATAGEFKALDGSHEGGAIAINVGSSKRTSWRFSREALKK